MSTQLNNALQCAAELEYCIARHGMRDAFTLNAYRAMKMVRTQHARITELESQLAQRFDAADMATAAAQGFRDGVASAASWISVDERLPEKNTEVLICFAELSIPSTGRYTASALDHEGWCYPQENHIWPGERPDFEDGGSPTVTHWMPIPAAPGPADGESNG